jgi:hypothetical protein
VLNQPCMDCCALCSNRQASHVVVGACEDCNDAAAEYCAVGERGTLVTASVQPWGQCGEDILGECLVECCDGSVLTFPSGSRNECVAEVTGSEPCTDSDCSEACGDGDCSGAPVRIAFNGQDQFVDECDGCQDCSSCGNGVPCTSTSAACVRVCGVEGIAYCHLATSCNPALSDSCATSDDCAAGEVCAVNTCCGRYCLPISSCGTANASGNVSTGCPVSSDGSVCKAPAADGVLDF